MLRSWKKPFFPLVKKCGRYKENKNFADPPIFIGGCARSGTTLLLSVLSAHPEIFAFPKELGLFNKVYQDESGRWHPSREDRLYFHLLKNTVKPTARRWLEKSPSNVTRIREIDDHFQGRFKLIHLIRDGRDVVLSVHPTDPSRYWVDPEKWVNDVSLGLAFEDHPQVHTLRYEDLIVDFENTMAKLLSFLELPYTDEVQDWHDYTTVRKNEAYFGPVQDIHAKSIEKWKRTTDTERIDTFLEYPGAVELLERCGYPI